MDDSSAVSKRFIKLMQLAHKEAQKVDGNHKLGAILVKGGRILAKSGNNYTNYRHAEVACLSKVWESERIGAILIVARTRKTQMYGMAKPCPDCENFIRDSGIKKVYYSNNDNEISCERY